MQSGMRLVTIVLMLACSLAACGPPSAPDLCRRNCQVWATCNHLNGDDEARCIQMMRCDEQVLSSRVACCLDHCFDMSCAEYLACEQICFSQ